MIKQEFLVATHLAWEPTNKLINCLVTWEVCIVSMKHLNLHKCNANQCPNVFLMQIFSLILIDFHYSGIFSGLWWRFDWKPFDRFSQCRIIPLARHKIPCSSHVQEQSKYYVECPNLWNVPLFVLFRIPFLFFCFSSLCFCWLFTLLFVIIERVQV